MWDELRKCRERMDALQSENATLWRRIAVAIEPIDVSDVAVCDTITTRELRELLGDEGFDEIDIADTKYIVVDGETMDAIMWRAYRELRPKVAYEWNVWDCDNYAELTRVLVAYSVYRAGFENQIALGTGWSRVHAFNVAVVEEDGVKKVVIYEPQTGRRVSRRTGAYEPVEAFFTT